MAQTKVKQELINASFGNVLEYFTYIPDGRTITTTQGDITVTNQTTYVASSNTIQDTGGSAITYIPPTGTKYVEYIYSGNWTYNDSNPILHFRIQLDGTDITHSQQTEYYGGVNPDSHALVKAVIEITGSGSDDVANGKVDTWTSGKVIRAAFRQYSATYEGVVNALRRWDATSSLTYKPGLYTIIAYK